MRNATVMTAAMLLAGAVAVPIAVRAATIQIGEHTPEYVKNHCGGGTYSTGPNGTYGCTAHDGSGIVCGGPGKDSKTCTTWGAATRILPSQAEVRAAEAAAKASK